VLVTNHVLAGALVGHLAAGPVAAFGLGVASHLAMDVVPHWGGFDIREVMPVAVTDGLLGASALLAVAVAAPRASRTRVVAGMLGAAFPDADKPSSVFFGRSPFPRAVDAFHARIQTESPRRMPQEVLVATGLALLVRRVLRAG
jgi:hypothetical protein